MGNRLENKVAIITGGGKGIGKSITKVFASEGAVVIIADKDKETGKKTEKEILDMNLKAKFILANVADLADMKSVAEEAIDLEGKIDILCSNAGIFPSVRIEDMTEEEWDLVHSVNLKGTFFAVQSCLPNMKKNNYGKVIITSSITGPITGFPGWAHYGATKSGINGFIRTAAIEFAKHNITINAVMPGNIMTEGMETVGEDYIEMTEKCIPIGRLGDPEDVAYAMLFLATDESKYITGQTLVVDGGQTLPESILAVGRN